MRIYDRWLSHGRSVDSIRNWMCREESKFCKTNYGEKDEL